MRAFTLPQLALSVRQRANLSGQQNPYGSNTGTQTSDNELTTNINSSVAELWDILITEKPSDNYNYKTYNIPIVANTSIYALPWDFFKLRGVDGSVNGGSWWFDILPYNEHQRNMYSYVNTVLAPQPPWYTAMKYQLQGGNISFIPVPVTSANIPLTRLTYYQTAPILVANLPPNYVGYPTPNVYQMNAYVVATVNGIDQIFQAGNTGTVGAFLPTWNIPGTTLDGSILWSYVAPLSMFATTFDGINGWEDYVIVDAAIKSLMKIDSPLVSEFMQYKEAIRARIQAAADNRNQGDALVISGGFGGDQGGFGIGGGFG